ncbi:hypothetical protein KUCAC02_011832, partial [Chaenocephalus aceratus]
SVHLDPQQPLENKQPGRTPPARPFTRPPLHLSFLIFVLDNPASHLGSWGIEALPEPPFWKHLLEQRVTGESSFEIEGMNRTGCKPALKLTAQEGPRSDGKAVCSDLMASSVEKRLCCSPGLLCHGCIILVWTLQESEASVLDIMWSGGQTSALKGQETALCPSTDCTSWKPLLLSGEAFESEPGAKERKSSSLLATEGAVNPFATEGHVFGDFIYHLSLLNEQGEIISDER